MPNKKDEDKRPPEQPDNQVSPPDEDKKPDYPEGTVWFKHDLNNCQLPLQISNIKEGKAGITVTFQKDPKVKWGLYRESDPKIIGLIKANSFFGKRIFVATDKEVDQLAEDKPKPKYKQGVTGAVK